MKRDGCLAAEDLAAFASAERSPRDLAEVEKHLDSCADCRAVLGALLPSELSEKRAPEPPITDGGEAPLPPGTTIGRFVIGALLGVGGMGMVYAARDPELNREVAIKLLRRRSGDDGLASCEARLRREAQAMARLSHPNVVPIFDVGTYEGRLSVAMELVEGGTLREWLAREKRSTAEIVDAFAKAGRGLAAAHSATLIHRDFKPDNVLVGKDGQVRVTDFGLARFGGDTETGGASATSSGERSIGDSITRTGTMLGTPAYMSPEQLTGLAADARTDQFSFCVALYEALAGVRPFASGYGRTLADPALRTKLDGIERIPRWLRKPLLRGLSQLPDARFPDMAALLGELRPAPPAGRRRWLALATGGALLGTLVVARDRRAHALECQAIGQRSATAWGDADREAVERAFVATGRPNAENTFHRTAAVLDAYAAKWSSLAVESCQSRREERSGELALQRGACFDARLGELQAFAGVLRRADGETLDRAVRGARALSSIETCVGRDPSQGEPVASDPAVRDEARALEQELREAAALRTAGRFAESLAASTKNLAEAERIAVPALRARALLMLAQAQEESGYLTQAEGTYHRAGIAAEEVGLWQVAARASIGEAWRASDRGDFDRADERFDHAGVWVGRAGVEDRLRGDLLLARGRELVDRGKYDDARALDAKALALFERAGSDEATDALNELGITADYQGRYEEARGYYQRALDRFDEILGPDSLKAAAELGNLGLLEGDQGHDEEALRNLSRAFAITEKARGPDDPRTGEAISNLALVLSTNGRPAEALPLALRAVAIAEKTFGPDALDVAVALGPLTASYSALGRYEEAIPPAERELAIRSREGTPINIADASANLGMALVLSGRDKARGRKLLEQARDGFVAVGRKNRLDEIDRLLRE